MEHLTEIERLAVLMFPAHGIGLMASLNPLVANDAFEQAMLRGWLKEEAEIHKSVFDLVKAGDAPIHTLAW
ncbi:MAG: hypothetical protein ACRYFX_14560 [Janthinobacterium lividum]